MEEGNRSYHPSHHFPTRNHHRQQHHHRVADADAVADADFDADMATTTLEDRSPQTFTDMIVASEQQQELQELQADSSNMINNSRNRNSDGYRGGEKREGRISFEQKLPSLSYLLRTTTNPLPRRSTGTTGDVIVPRSLKMVAVDTNNDQQQPYHHRHHHHQQQQQQQQRDDITGERHYNNDDDDYDGVVIRERYYDNDDDYDGNNDNGNDYNSNGSNTESSYFSDEGEDTNQEQQQQQRRQEQQPQLIQAEIKRTVAMGAEGIQYHQSRNHSNNQYRTKNQCQRQRRRQEQLQRQRQQQNQNQNLMTQNLKIEQHPSSSLLRPGKVYRVSLRRHQHQHQRQEGTSKFTTENNFVSDNNRSKSKSLPTTTYATTSKDSNNDNKNSNRIIFTYKTWDATEKKWRRTKTYTANKVSQSSSSNNKNNASTQQHHHNHVHDYYYYRIPLTRGGTLSIFPNLYPLSQIKKVKNELLQCQYWRKYTIQGGDEPRLHFLAHDDATETETKNKTTNTKTKAKTETRTINSTDDDANESKTTEIEIETEKQSASSSSSSTKITTAMATTETKADNTSTRRYDMNSENNANTITNIVNSNIHDNDDNDDKDDNEEYNFKYKTKQPGYRYANITMKARPLRQQQNGSKSRLKNLHKLSKDIAILRRIPNLKWNIGVHSVLYRDNKDSMGDHADDDQGETLIFCVVIESPTNPRKVVIKVFDKLTLLSKNNDKGNNNKEEPVVVGCKKIDTNNDGSRRKVGPVDRIYQEGDEYIELRLKPGDAYEMDGQMQESYSHCIPKDNNNNNDTNNCDDTSTTRTTSRRRICVVLRTGQQKYFEKDSGCTCNDLSPRKPIVYHIGPIKNLKEGNFYTRRQLLDIGAFQLSQRGISGCKQSGADAIIVSGERRGKDMFNTLKYVAEWRIGANALFKSFVQQSVIRVFRSLRYIRKNNIYDISSHDISSSCCTSTDTNNIKANTNRQIIHGSTPTLYRYDGLYTIVQIKAPTDPTGTFEFFLNRPVYGIHSSTSTLQSPPTCKKKSLCLNNLSSNRRKHVNSLATNTSIVDSTTRKRHKNNRDYVGSDISLKITWANEYGAEDLSCCATLLSLDNEINSVASMTLLLTWNKPQYGLNSIAEFKSLVIERYSSLASNSRIQGDTTYNRFGASLAKTYTSTMRKKIGTEDLSCCLSLLSLDNETKTVASMILLSWRNKPPYGLNCVANFKPLVIDDYSSFEFARNVLIQYDYMRDHFVASLTRPNTNCLEKKPSETKSQVKEATAKIKRRIKLRMNSRVEVGRVYNRCALSCVGTSIKSTDKNSLRSKQKCKQAIDYLLFMNPEWPCNDELFSTNRLPFFKINRKTLCKQKIRATKKQFDNKIVAQKPHSSSDIIKHERSCEEGYPLCESQLYFVLHYFHDGDQGRVVLVPVCKSGTFCRTRHDTFHGNYSGRPRFTIVVLDTNENWILGLAEEYLVVPAVSVAKHSLLVKDTWNITKELQVRPCPASIRSTNPRPKKKNRISETDSLMFGKGTSPPTSRPRRSLRGSRTIAQTPNMWSNIEKGMIDP